MQGTRRRDRREKEGGRGANARQGEEGRRVGYRISWGGTGLVRRLTGGYGRRSQREKEMNRGKKREGVGANTKIQQQ